MAERKTDEEVQAIMAKDPIAPLVTDETGLDAAEYVGRSFLNGNYEVPKPIWDAAMKIAGDLQQAFAKEHIALESVSYFKNGAKLDGKPGLAQEELAAQLLAISMANNTLTAQSRDSTKTTFDNDITEDDLKKAVRNPDHVAALARQIFGDTNPSLSPTDTTSPEGKAKDLPNIQAGGTTIRC